MRLTRADSSVLVRLVVHRRPADVLRPAAADGRGPRAVARGQPGRSPPNIISSRSISCAAKRPCSSLGRHHVRGLDSDAEADPAREPRDLRCRHCADGGDPRAWARDQRRQALAPDRLRLDPAVGIRQAGLHRADRLAVQREPEAARHPRHPACGGALRDLRRAAGSPARFRPDAARHPGLGRAVLYGRHQHGVDRRARRLPASAASSPPICLCRTSPRASTASSIRPPATPIRPTARSIRSCMAAGSAGAPARAR